MKQAIKKSASLLLILFLSSCVDIEFTRCIPMIEDGILRCHAYEVTDKNIGRVGPSENVNLDDVNGMICVPYSDWKETIYPELQRILD